MKISPITEKLVSRLTKYYDEDEFEVEVSSNYSDKYTDIEIVTNDKDVDEFFKFIDELDAIVQRFDQSSYFDVIAPGQYLARVYWDVAQKSSNPNLEIVLNHANLIKLGNEICYNLEDELNEEFFLDDISYDESSQCISIKISSESFDSSADVRVVEEYIDSYRDLIESSERKILKKLLQNLKEN